MSGQKESLAGDTERPAIYPVSVIFEVTCHFCYPPCEATFLYFKQNNSFETAFLTLQSKIKCHCIFLLEKTQKLLHTSRHGCILEDFQLSYQLQIHVWCCCCLCSLVITKDLVASLEHMMSEEFIPLLSCTAVLSVGLVLFIIWDHLLFIYSYYFGALQESVLGCISCNGMECGLLLLKQK